MKARTPYRSRGCHSIRLRRQRSERKAKPRLSSRRRERIGAPRHVRRSRNPPEIRSIRVRARKLDEREDANAIATTEGNETTERRGKNPGGISWPRSRTSEERLSEVRPWCISLRDRNLTLTSWQLLGSWTLIASNSLYAYTHSSLGIEIKRDKRRPSRRDRRKPVWILLIGHRTWAWDKRISETYASNLSHQLIIETCAGYKRYIGLVLPSNQALHQGRSILISRSSPWHCDTRRLNTMISQCPVWSINFSQSYKTTLKVSLIQETCKVYRYEEIWLYIIPNYIQFCDTSYEFQLKYWRSTTIFKLQFCETSSEFQRKR